MIRNNMNNNSGIVIVYNYIAFIHAMKPFPVRQNIMPRRIANHFIIVIINLTNYVRTFLCI